MTLVYCERVKTVSLRRSIFSQPLWQGALVKAARGGFVMGLQGPCIKRGATAQCRLA